MTAILIMCFILICFAVSFNLPLMIKIRPFSALDGASDEGPGYLCVNILLIILDQGSFRVIEGRVSIIVSEKFP